MASGYYDFSGAFGNLNSSIDGLRKRWDQNEQKRTLAELGQQVQAGNFDGAAQKAFSLGDAGTGLGILKLGQAAKQQALQQEASRSFMSGFGGGAPVSQAAPAAAIGNPTEVENRFIGGVRQAGLTNPVGLGAVAAYGRAESGFSPRNANRVWNDPSESGQAGQSGGIMSWRADRLRNLYSFAQQRGEQPGNISPETQAMFLAQEDPTLIPKLQSAKSPEEANGIMANAWRFAGYNRPGGENARRLAMTQHYASRFGQQPAAQPVQVAENEQDVQRLEAQMPGYGGAQPAQQPPVQVAQAQGGPQADLPAQGAANAQGYVIPPGQNPDIPPNDPAPRISNQALMAAQANPNLPQAQREMAKAIVERRLRYSDENSPIKTQNMRLQNEKLQRELQGEEPIALTQEERQKFGIAPDQAAYRTRDGIKFGPAGTKIINEAQKIQGAEDKARVDINTKFLGALADSGPKVAQRMADMDVLAAVIRDAPQTPVPDAQVFFDRLGAGLGLSKGELATRSDAMKAIIQRLAPAQREEGSGSTSDIEFKGMLASFPSLAATGEGRQMILTTIARQNEINRMRIEVADMWAQGEIPATEARKRIAQIDRASIFASEDEKKLIRKLAGTAKGGDLGASSGTMERTVNGKTYVQRGGQWYAKEGFQ